MAGPARDHTARRVLAARRCRRPQRPETSIDIVTLLILRLVQFRIRAGLGRAGWSAPDVAVAAGERWYYSPIARPSMQPENQRESRDAPYGAIGNGGAELVGRRWYVNLRSSDHTFDGRPFADSVLVHEVTPTYITV